MLLSRILILCSILTFLFSQNTLSIANVDTSTGTLDVYMENDEAVGVSNSPSLSCELVLDSLIL